jgi:hypothetical protein
MLLKLHALYLQKENSFPYAFILFNQIVAVICVS